jgi:hypothetical protein
MHTRRMHVRKKKIFFAPSPKKKSRHTIPVAPPSPNTYTRACRPRTNTDRIGYPGMNKLACGRSKRVRVCVYFSRRMYDNGARQATFVRSLPIHYDIGPRSMHHFPHAATRYYKRCHRLCLRVTSRSTIIGSTSSLPSSSVQTASPPLVVRHQRIAPHGRYHFRQ